MKLSLTLALTALTVACSPSNKTQKFAAGTPQLTRSEEISKQLIEAPSSKAVIQKLKDSSWRQIWKTVTRISSNNAFTIDGLTFDGVRQAAYDLEPEVDILDQRFGTIGEYIDETDIVLPLTTTSAAFREAVIKAHAFFSGENEWQPIKNLFESDSFDTLIEEEGTQFGTKKEEEKSKLPEVEETKTNLCDTKSWEAGRDPSVLSNIAACARDLTALENTAQAPTSNATSFGVDTDKYLKGACSALFVLTVATASAGLAADEVCDASF